MAAMVKPRVDKLMKRTDSHYAAVVVAAKRARQLNSYYRALGEGTYEEHTPPMVETETGNYLTCLLYTSPSPRDGLLSRMPSSA